MMELYHNFHYQHILIELIADRIYRAIYKLLYNIIFLPYSVVQRLMNVSGIYILYCTLHLVQGIDLFIISTLTTTISELYYLLFDKFSSNILVV